MTRALIIVTCLSLVPACAKQKPTEKECQAFSDHLIELLRESKAGPEHRIKRLADSHKERILELCVLDGTKEEVDCVLDQSSIEDVEANCK